MCYLTAKRFGALSSGDSSERQYWLMDFDPPLGMDDAFPRPSVMECKLWPLIPARRPYFTTVAMCESGSL
jgi:hypothetical protein